MIMMIVNILQYIDISMSKLTGQQKYSILENLEKQEFNPKS